jgi:hypothetical protein
MTFTFYYNSIAKNLTQGATEVTISRVKMTQIFLQCIALALANSSAVSFEIS